MKKWRLLILVIIIAVLASFLFWSVASASQSFRSGNTVTVGSEEVVDNTLWVSGRTLDIAGQVNGDVFCVGQNVTVSGRVNGDLLCAAQTIVISGTVTGSVRSAAQTVTVSGIVARNLSAVGQSYNQGSDSDVRGDLSVAANDASVNGIVGRDASFAAQTITLGGQIGRDVTSTVQDLKLNRGAKINGNLSYTSTNNARISSGAVVSGETVKSLPKDKAGGKDATSAGAFGFGFALYMLAAGLLVALLLVLLFPQAIHAVTSQAVRSPWKVLLVGFVAAIAVPVIIVLLMFTVIGIPLALIIIVAWILIQALAGVMSAYYLGRLILRKQRKAPLIMLVGAVLLIILYFIPVVGFIFLLLAMLMGTGMILLELGHRRPVSTYDVR